MAKKQNHQESSHNDCAQELCWVGKVAVRISGKRRVSSDIMDVRVEVQDALEKLEQHTYSLILMDVQMHGMDGFEVTKIIRADEKEQALPHIPIVAMTANAMAEDRKKCLAAGMDDYLAKPFKESELKRILGYFNESFAAPKLGE